MSGGPYQMALRGTDFPVQGLGWRPHRYGGGNDAGDRGMGDRPHSYGGGNDAGDRGVASAWRQLRSVYETMRGLGRTDHPPKHQAYGMTGTRGTWGDVFKGIVGDAFSTYKGWWVSEHQGADASGTTIVLPAPAPPAKVIPWGWIGGGLAAFLGFFLFLRRNRRSK